MRSLLLSFMLLFCNYQDARNITKVNIIEYYSNSHKDDIITLNINITATKRDVIELKIYFCDENKNNLNKDYFSSALTIQGNKKTEARIPIHISEKMYLNIVFYSSNLDKEIENVMFPIYKNEDLICDLNETKICKSNNPVHVIYENKKIREIYEKIAVSNETLMFKSFNNIVPIEDIRLICNNQINDGEMNLYIKEKIDEYSLYYKEGYAFNLEAYVVNNVIRFAFMDYHYVDLHNGKMYDNYISDGVYIKDVILPYRNKEYNFVIELKDCFVSFKTVKLDFKVKTKGDLIGGCETSKYCLRRSYL